MNRSIAIVVLLSLSFVACGTEEPKNTETTKIAESREPLGSIESPKAEQVEKNLEEPIKTVEAPKPPAFSMDRVHAHLKADNKLEAIKEYRELHAKLALNASKFGVELEKQKLGMPSVMDVQKLYFEGKKDEALKALAALYSRPAESNGIQLLWGNITKMGLATEDNLKAQADAGESTAALAIYHQLYPRTPIPEAWRAVEVLMGK